MVLFLTALMIVCILYSVAVIENTRTLAKRKNYRAAYQASLKAILSLLFASLNGLLIALITSNLKPP